MEKTWKIFDEYADEYDTWYEKYPLIYESEILAIRPHLILTGKSLEIGIGTGRFAKALGIKFGIDPAFKMVKLAKERGINVIIGIAEKLPFLDNTFELILMITTLCFIKNPLKAIEECRRVLKPKGKLVLGIIDKNSFLGRLYEEKKNKSKFYKNAKFFSTKEIIFLLKNAGFLNFKITQTLFKPIYDISEVELVKEGYGKGGFVVISAEKP
ncbi:SAM-dependent methyltransferase [Candidatus Pacearchaeota archaeon]|nr:MAG: SAM-dependent methyltransferase [Candidatus Pacearchaeota archaeon]